MPDLNTFAGVPIEWVFAAITDDGRNAVDVTAGANQDIATPAFWLHTGAHLLGYDPTDGNWDALATEGADVRNLRIAVYDGAAGPADVAAAAATLDETAATFLKGMSALYAMGAADLDRLLAQGSDSDNVANVATGLLRTAAYNYGYDGAAWDRILAVAGAMVVTGPYEDEDAWTFGTSRVFPMGAVADDAVVDSLAEDQVGIPRMTLTRVLNAVLSDPTTITQRQRVLAAAATQDETLTQYATGAAVLYGHDTAAVAGTQLVKVEVESTASPNLRSALYDGDAGPADIAAAGATLDETATTFLKGMSALYAMGAADLDRLLAQGNDGDNVASVATGLLRTAAYNYLYDSVGANWDRALGVGGAMVVTGPLVDDAAFTAGTDRVFPMGAFADDAAVDSVDENDIGTPRMTLTRVLNVVATDPTTITQRQGVLTATGAKAENTAQWATVLAALSALDTAAGAGSQQVPLLVESTAQPNLRIGLYEAGDEAQVRTPTDAAAAANGLLVESAATLYNEAANQWDRARNNHDISALASGSDTANGRTGAAVTNYNWKGALIALSITVVNGTGSFTDLTIQAQGPDASWVTIYSFAALGYASTGVRFFQIYPGAASAGSFARQPFQGVLPRTFRVNTVTATDAVGNNLTYEVELQGIL